MQRSAVKQMLKRTTNIVDEFRSAVGVANFEMVPSGRVARFADLPSGQASSRPAPIDVDYAEEQRPRTVQAQPNPTMNDYRATKFAGFVPRTAEVTGGRVATEGVGVLSADGVLVGEALWDEEHLQRSFGRRVRVPAATHVDGQLGSLMSLWCDNYYHWLIDSLPRLHVLQTAGYLELPLLVPARLSRFQRDSLTALGIRPERLVPYTGSHVSADELVWASGAAPIAFCTTQAAGWLRDSFAADVVKSGRRLLISRRERRLSNEDEVMSAIADFGFELVRPEELTFAQQVELFGGADIVIGPHGAGMANIVFGRELKVLELFQPRYINPCQYAVARAAGHPYWYLIGEPAGDLTSAKSTDIRVDPAQVVASVAEMLAGGSATPGRLG
ncbi:MAG: hypothetical protein JWN95_3566 [Frankiales bacterium]|nr:hypothetical protein [Frankiales bacterium]